MNAKSAVLMVPVLLLVTAVRAEDNRVFDVVPVETLQLDSQPLAEFDEQMRGHVENGKVAGSLALVARGDQVGWFRMWGDRDREQKRPMTADTIFRIYSMSKPITSVAAMQLVERGAMQLDDPVSKYLPELAGLKVLEGRGDAAREVPAKREITVRDLLRHTSGFTYGFFGNTPVDQAYRTAGILSRDQTLADTIRKLGETPLLYQPGSRWHYGVSTDVTGRLVEVVSEERFDRYLQRHIFDVLDMPDTSFMVPAEKLSRFAQMYQPDGDGLKPASPLRSLRFTSPQNRFFSGGGGLCSTARDYLRFCRALLRGGELDGKRILKSETVDLMTRNQLNGIVSRRQFGLGFAISPEGEYSWGGAAGTRFWVNPRRNLIGVFMIQINPYNVPEYGNQLKRMVTSADRRPLEPAATSTK